GIGDLIVDALGTDAVRSPALSVQIGRTPLGELSEFLKTFLAQLDLIRKTVLLAVKIGYPFIFLNQTLWGHLLGQLKGILVITLGLQDPVMGRIGIRNLGVQVDLFGGYLVLLGDLQGFLVIIEGILQ